MGKCSVLLMTGETTLGYHFSSIRLAKIQFWQQSLLGYSFLIIYCMRNRQIGFWKSTAQKWPWPASVWEKFWYDQKKTWCRLFCVLVREAWFCFSFRVNLLKIWTCPREQRLAFSSTSTPHFDRLTSRHLLVFLPFPWMCDLASRRKHQNARAVERIIGIYSGLHHVF